MRVVCSSRLSRPSSLWTQRTVAGQTQRYHSSRDPDRMAEPWRVCNVQRFRATPGKVTIEPSLGDLRLAAAEAFPGIPSVMWKNSLYYMQKQPKFGSLKKISLHDVAKPRGDKRYPRLPGRLSPFKRPPPGLDVMTIEVDRQAFRTAQYGQHIRRLLRVHFALCTTATDVLRVVAVAMQRNLTASFLPSSHLRIIQALFRSRDRVSDQRICSVIRTLIKRMRMAKLPVPYELYACGLKFSARSRNLDRLRWFLVQFREENLLMSRNLFRSVIAKCGIGHRGLGEIRNGKWDHDQLRQAMFGFFDAETEIEKHAHLETWLERRDWQEVQAWWRILYVIGAKDKAKDEWAVWRNATARKGARTAQLIREPPSSTTIKIRADSFILRTMLHFEDLATAWEVLLDNPSVWTMLDGETRGTLKSYGELQAGFEERLRRVTSHATQDPHTTSALIKPRLLNSDAGVTDQEKRTTHLSRSSTQSTKLNEVSITIFEPSHNETLIM